MRQCEQDAERIQLDGLKAAPDSSRWLHEESDETLL